MSYPREESIQQATEVFWQKGYLGTGMRDLQTALDKRPGSIYAAFGNKEGLYLAVLEHYTMLLGEQIQNVAESSTPLHALSEFLRRPLTMTEDSAHKIQCLIVKTQADWTELPHGVRDSLQTALARLREQFKAVILQAQVHNELTDKVPVERAAIWLQSQFIAMRTMATTVDEPLTLAWMVDKIITDLKNGWSLPE